MSLFLQDSTTVQLTYSDLYVYITIFCIKFRQNVHVYKQPIHHSISASISKFTALSLLTLTPDQSHKRQNITQLNIHFMPL